MSQIIDLYESFKNECTCFVDEPMSKHTTFKVGGKADIILFPKSEEQIQKIILECKNNNVRWQVIGNGSNLLVKDDGVRGAVMVVGSDMNNVFFENGLLVAQAGASLSSVCMNALNQSLGGLEFAWGIPGNVGGAIFMNAGAYGGEMKQVLQSVTIYADGAIQTLPVDALELSYRHSIFMDHPDWIVLSATFKLTKGDHEQIIAQMSDLNARRREKQPLQYPSSGSFFKRPEGHFAGALIEQANLKGFTIGGAQVSQLHAGFVINIGNATADDIYQLMKHVQKTVFDIFSVELHPEVRLIGQFEK